MRVLLFYPDDQYLVVLHLTPEEMNLIADVEDEDHYSAIEAILEKRNLPHDIFVPLWSIDSADCGFEVFEDDDKCPVYTIK